MPDLSKSARRFWVGADPGGAGKFGLTFLDATGEYDSCSVTVSSVDDAVKEIEKRGAPLGLGIDAPMWWASNECSNRKADEKVRSLRQYTDMNPSTVQSPNSLRGAALIGGMMLALRIREKFPDTRITESHPKAVIHTEVVLRICKSDPVFSNYVNEYERDARIAAVCAREGFEERWTIDLANDRYRSEQDPFSYWLVPVHYFWPEPLPASVCA